MNFLLYCIMKHDSGILRAAMLKLISGDKEPLPTPLHFEGHVTLAANALRSIDILACFLRAYQVMMFNSVISTWDSSIKNLTFIKYLVILKYGLIEEGSACSSLCRAKELELPHRSLP